MPMLQLPRRIVALYPMCTGAVYFLPLEHCRLRTALYSDDGILCNTVLQTVFGKRSLGSCHRSDTCFSMFPKGIESSYAKC